MTYEVVWSRALSMAIGSSMQAFALILATFLSGIAGGSGLLAALLSSGARRLLPAVATASAAAGLSSVALAPAFLLSSRVTASAVFGLALALTGGPLALAIRRRERLAQLAPEAGSALSDELERTARRTLLVPCAIAAFEAVRFAGDKSSLSAATRHGYLPYITAGVVLSVTSLLWLASRLRKSPWSLAAAMQLNIALSTLIGGIFQDEIPYTFARLVSSLGDLSDHVATVRLFMLITASLCTLPAALGMGAMFPITLELWRTERAAVGEHVGQVYLANTTGSIVGAWLPGFVLMPWLGMQQTLCFGMLLNAGFASAMLLARDPKGERSRPSVLAWASCALFGLCAWLLVAPPTAFRWNLSHMTLGAFRVSLAREVLDTRSWGNPDLVFYRDGVSTTVSVERWGRHLSLKNNGKVDASNGNDMPTQILVAAYPLLLHPRGPSGLDVAIVGFGSGVTVGAALQFPVRHVDAVELERAVVEAGATFFADVSHLPRRMDRFPFVRDPRLTVHNDDGRNFLAAQQKQYDVIISEPSNPWITGVSDLFTTEHFVISKRRLKPDGVYCQWVQLYEMSPDNIKTIYRTFASQFRHVVAFAAEELSSDTILVGSDRPIALSLTQVRKAMAPAKAKQELARAYIHSPSDALSRLLFATKKEVLRFTQRELRRSGADFLEEMRATGARACPADSCRREPAQLNTDDNMRIETRAPADLIGFSRYEGYLSIFYGRDWPYGRLEERLSDAKGPEDLAEVTLALLAQGRERAAKAFLARLAAASAPGEARLARDAARLLLGDEPAPGLTPGDVAPTPQMSAGVRAAFDRTMAEIRGAMARGDAQTALGKLEALPEPLQRLSGPELRTLRAQLLYRAAVGDRATYKKSVAAFETVIREHEHYTRAHPELYYYLAKALYAASSFDKAVRNMLAYAQIRNPAGGPETDVTTSSQ